MGRLFYLARYHQKKVTGPQQDSNSRHVSTLHLRLIIISALMLFILFIFKDYWLERASVSAVRQLSNSQTVGRLFQNTERIF